MRRAGEQQSPPPVPTAPPPKGFVGSCPPALSQVLTMKSDMLYKNMTLFPSFPSLILGMMPPSPAAFVHTGHLRPAKMEPVFSLSTSLSLFAGLLAH